MRSIALALTIAVAVFAFASPSTCTAQDTDWPHKIRNLTDADVDIDILRLPYGGMKTYFLHPGQITTGKIKASRISVQAVYIGANGPQFVVKTFDRLKDEGTIHLNAVLVNGKFDVRRGKF